MPSTNLGDDKDTWNSWGEGKEISITDNDETGARHSVGYRLTAGGLLNALSPVQLELTLTINAQYA